jgi:hypothetical protein
MTYRIDWTDGRTETHETYETYEAATDAVLAELGADAEIGHDGDLPDGGDRTLCWATLADSEDDDGANAVCEIRRVPA